MPKRRGPFSEPSGDVRIPASRLKPQSNLLRHNENRTSQCARPNANPTVNHPLISLKTYGKLWQDSILWQDTTPAVYMMAMDAMALDKFNALWHAVIPVCLPHLHAMTV